MSTTLFFLVPIGMLAVVWSFCFVGACFPTSGLPGPPYSNTILNEPSLIAYWPLSDFPNSQLPAGAPALPPPPQGSTSVGIALDLTGKNHNGSYINPPAYPSGTTTPQVGANPTLNLHQASIVAGDAFAVGSKNLPACVDFEGGYVSIPWAANSPALTDFTLEAWIKPRWMVTGFIWYVFGARTNNGTGFALYINAQNQWELTIGDGTAPTNVNTMVQAAVNNSLTYVAVTFKSATQVLSLWINPASDSDSNTPAAADSGLASPSTCSTYDNDLRRNRSDPADDVLHRRRRQSRCSDPANAGWRRRRPAASFPGPDSVGRAVQHRARAHRSRIAFPKRNRG